MFHGYKAGDAVTLVEAYIGNKLSLLQQKLTAADVICKSMALFPPGDLWIKMCAGKVFISRWFDIRRRVCKGVDHQSVYSGTKSLIRSSF